MRTFGDGQLNGCTSWHHQIVVFGPDGNIMHVFGTAAPAGALVRSDGGAGSADDAELFLADCHNHRFGSADDERSWNSDDEWQQWFWRGGGIAVDGEAELLYVASDCCRVTGAHVQDKLKSALWQSIGCDERMSGCCWSWRKKRWRCLALKMVPFAAWHPRDVEVLWSRQRAGGGETMRARIECQCDFILLKHDQAQ
jgi:hypothetical protein